MTEWFVFVWTTWPFMLSVNFVNSSSFLSNNPSPKTRYCVVVFFEIVWILIQFMCVIFSFSFQPITFSDKYDKELIIKEVGSAVHVHVCWEKGWMYIYRTWYFAYQNRMEFYQIEKSSAETGTSEPTVTLWILSTCYYGSFNNKTKPLWTS